MPSKRVVTISDCDPDCGDSGDPLLVAQVTPATVRAVMQLLTEALELPADGEGEERD
jgi:hypothetical protein